MKSNIGEMHSQKTKKRIKVKNNTIRNANT